MKKISMLSLMLMGAFAVSNANATITVTTGTGDGGSTQHQASASIKPAVTIAHGADINFGELLLSVGGTGDITLTPTAGTFSKPTLGTGQAYVSDASVSQGSVTISNPSTTARTATITIGTSGSASELTNGSNNNLKMNLAPTITYSGNTTPSQSLSSVSLPAASGGTAGSLVIYTGGTLTPKNGSNLAAEGVYTGDVPVTVQY